MLLLDCFYWLLGREVKFSCCAGGVPPWLLKYIIYVILKPLRTQSAQSVFTILCVPLCTLWLNIEMIPAPHCWYIAVFALMIGEHRPGLGAGHEPGSCIQLLCRWSAAMAVEIYNISFLTADKRG